MFGRVIRCKKDRGFCFIKGEDDNMYFCHFSNTDDGLLEVGYLVHFHVAYDKKNDRTQAKNVQVVDSWYRAYK